MKWYFLNVDTGNAVTSSMSLKRLTAAEQMGLNNPAVPETSLVNCPSNTS